MTDVAPTMRVAQEEIFGPVLGGAAGAQPRSRDRDRQRHPVRPVGRHLHALADLGLRVHQPDRGGAGDGEPAVGGRRVPRAVRRVEGVVAWACASRAAWRSTSTASCRRRISSTELRTRDRTGLGTGTRDALRVGLSVQVQSSVQTRVQMLSSPSAAGSRTAELCSEDSEFATLSRAVGRARRDGGRLVPAGRGLGRRRQSRRSGGVGGVADRRGDADGRRAGPVAAAAADRVAGGLGGGRHLLPQPHGADGGVEVGGRRRLLRSRLRGARGRSCSSRRRRSRVRGHGQPVRIRKDSRWNVPEPELALVCQRRRHDRRLHHRQRHELARHRGREPALPAAGEGLRRQLRARARRSACRRRRCRRRPRSVW